MKEYKIDIRIKNNLIYQKIRLMGFNSIADFCRKCKIHKGLVGDIINMKIPAINRYGEWTHIIKELCDIFGCEPEDIITDEQKTIAYNKKIEIYADAQQLAQLSNNCEKYESIEYVDQEIDQEKIKEQIEIQLNTLTPREQKVLKMRFGIGYETEHSLTQVANVYGITAQRIRMIEEKALRKLRHPSRAIPLLKADIITLKSNEYEERT